MINTTFEFEMEDTAFVTSTVVLEEKKYFFFLKKVSLSLGEDPGGRDANVFSDLCVPAT